MLSVQCVIQIPCGAGCEVWTASCGFSSGKQSRRRSLDCFSFAGPVRFPKCSRNLTKRKSVQPCAFHTMTGCRANMPGNVRRAFSFLIRFTLLVDTIMGLYRGYIGDNEKEN